MMPFHDSVYFPFSGETQGTHSSAGIPSLLNSPLSQPSSSSTGHHTTAPTAASIMTPSSVLPSALPPFKFRPRRESVDWRRIGAVDVERLASELDVDALQEHVNAVTFCSVEGERCQRCQTPVDPALVKLFRLAQLTVEWLLHCQGYLTLNLRGAEERLAAAGGDRERLLAQQKRQEEKARALGAELKQRKKIIRSQQSMFAPRLVTSQKCPCCEKAFMNSSFLQNHMQRRHPDEYEIQLRIDNEKKSQIDGLKQEISGLKEQLVQQQQTLQAKTVQEKEQQSMFKDMMRELDRFRAEDMVRMDRKIEDSRDGIRREMEFFYSKNLQELNQIQTSQRDTPASPVQRQAERDLDNYKEIQTQAIQRLEQQLRKQDKKWESRIDEVKSQHESEKNRLLNELSVMKSSVSESKERSHRLKQEMGRRLQEREHTITAQREQIKNISMNPPTKVVEVPVIITAPAPEPKPKKVQLDSSSLSERRPEVRRPEVRKQPAAPSTVHSLRNNPNIRRELRPALEQALIQKLEELGVNPGQSGLRNKEYSALAAKVHAERESVAREVPDYWRHREEVASVLEQRLRGGMRRGSDPALEPRSRTKHSTQVSQNRPRSSSLPSRVTQVVSGPAPAKRTKTPQPVPRTRTSTLPKTSTPNAKSSTPNVKTSTPKTPPFSSDEESEEDETDDEEEEQPVKLRQDPRGKSPQPKPSQAKPAQARASKASPVLARQTQAKPLAGARPQQPRGPGGVVTRTAVTEVDSDEGWSDVSEMQEIDPRQLHGYRDQNGNMERKNTAKDSKISDISRQLEKQLGERGAKRPAGGVSVIPDMVQDLTYTDLEESSEWLVSSLEDAAGVQELSKPGSGPGPLRKSLDSPSTSVWGSSTGNRQKSGLTEVGTGGTLKSSLVSLSDFSDSDDI